MTESHQLSSHFRNSLFEILSEIPALQDEDTRNLLLRGLPPEPVGTIRRHPAPMTDLNNILEAAAGWGKLDSGELALVVIAQNALSLAKGTQPGGQLEVLLAEFEKH